MSISLDEPRKWIASLFTSFSKPFLVVLYWQPWSVRRLVRIEANRLQIFTFCIWIIFSLWHARECCLYSGPTHRKPWARLWAGAGPLHGIMSDLICWQISVDRTTVSTFSPARCRDVIKHGYDNTVYTVFLNNQDWEVDKICWLFKGIFY